MSQDEFITRTIRIPRKHDDILRKISNDTGRSVSAIINQILEPYIHFTRFYHQGQIMTVDIEEIKLIMETMTDEEAYQTGRKTGQKRAKDNLLMLGLSLDFNSIKWYITEVMDKYCGWFKCTYYKQRTEHVFHIRHRLNRQWSIFIRAYFEAMIGSLMDIGTELNLTDTTVTMRISNNQNK